MPLQPKKKSPPPDGFTGWGHNSSKINDAQVQKWIGEKSPQSNIALRSRRDHMGIDVDAYKGSGEDTYSRIVADMGPLPATWVSSARDDGASGIRHYRLPEGAEELAWPGKIGDGIETVHYGHRYTVAPPSVHPEKDEFNQPQIYRWYAPGEDPVGFGSSDIPRFEDLTELPMEWVEYFTKGRYHRILPEKDLGTPRESTKFVTAWIAERAGEPCARMVSSLERITEGFEGAGAHDNGRDGIWELMCLSAEGHPGLSEVISNLHDSFIAEATDEYREGTSRGPAEAEKEWLDYRDRAVKKVLIRMEAGDWEGSKCSCTGFTPEGRPKERIDVDSYHIHDALAICYDAVRARKETGWLGMYHSNGKMRELTPYGLREVTVNSLRPIVARRVDWIRWKGGENPMPVPVNPTKDFLGSMLEDATMRDELPEIRGVVRTPYYALVDGEPVLLSENGYHRAAKVYMQMDERLANEMVDKMNEEPPYSWVEKAKKLIGDIFFDFPFVSRADKATAYAALILPFVRELVEGPTPLHLIDAPKAGTGKGLLTEVIGLISCGTLEQAEGYHTVAVTDDRNRNVELAKEITTRLSQFPRVLVLDNVNHKLDSGPIASALTSETFQARLYGKNDQMIQMPNRALWIATSNNLKASDEIRRRIVWCRMNAKVENPAERSKFKHADLLAYVKQNRPALVWAVLTIVANWIQEGMPGSNVKMGKYESWVSVVPGILECGGIEGLLENRQAFNEAAADEETTLDSLVEEWYATFKRERVSVEQLLTLEATDELVPTDAKSRGLRLGRLLAEAREQVVSGHMIIHTKPQNKSRFHLGDPEALKVGSKRAPKRKRLGSRG